MTKSFLEPGIILAGVPAKKIGVREGWEAPENAVALCPNCHRAMHFAADREERVRRLYSLFARFDAGACGADGA